MSNDIELEDLSAPRLQDEKEVADTTAHSARYDMSVTYWAYASAAIITALSLTLLLFPRFLLFLSTSSEFTERSLTPLERFLSVQFSFFLFAIALTLLLYIPSEEPVVPRRRRDALGHPLLGPLTFSSILSGFVSYNTSSTGALSFIVCLMTGTIGAWGLWVLLFEGTSRISKKTGADKHTSSFLFRNKKAASAQKKEWRKVQQGKTS